MAHNPRLTQLQSHRSWVRDSKLLNQTKLQSMQPLKDQTKELTSRIIEIMSMQPRSCVGTH